MTKRDIYASPNGDRWVLIDCPPTREIEHRANPASGGAVTRLGLSTFLRASNAGPEHEALRRLLAEEAAERRPLDMAGATPRRRRPRAPLTGAQIRAARAFVRWDEATLAERAGLPVETIARLEGSDGPLSHESARVLAAVVRAFESAGLDFIRGSQPGLIMRAMDLEEQIVDAERRADEDRRAREGMDAEPASPRKGMSALRHGLSANTLRTLRQRRERSKHG